MHSISSEHTYLIIAGTTRAGTTSLFLYLAEHPDICRSTVKESRFFLGPDYPIPAEVSYEEGLPRYLSLFENCPGAQRIRLEASPDYLYSAGTSRRIASSGLRTKLVFVLREPVDRLISWHKFAMMRGLVDQETTLDQFIDSQAQGDDLARAPYYYRVLHQGKYTEYLEPFLADFAPEDVLILFFENLSTNTQAVVEETARFAGIDPAYYRDREFAVHNPSKGIKSQGLNVGYLRAKSGLRKLSKNSPRVRQTLRKAGRLFDGFYARLNVKGDAPSQPAVTAAHAEFLRAYYADEHGKVAALVGRDAPWHFPELRIRDA